MRADADGGYVGAPGEGGGGHVHAVGWGRGGGAGGEDYGEEDRDRAVWLGEVG